MIKENQIDSTASEASNLCGKRGRFWNDEKFAYSPICTLQVLIDEKWRLHLQAVTSILPSKIESQND